MSSALAAALAAAPATLGLGLHAVLDPTLAEAPARAELRRVWGPSFEVAGASMETEATTAAGDLVVQQWRFVDGERVIRGVDLLRVRDGRICEKLGYVKAVLSAAVKSETMGADVADFLEELGFAKVKAE